MEETSGFSDAVRDDRGDEPGVAGRVLGGKVEAPAESVEAGSVGSAASSEAKDKEARPRVSEQRAAETERLGVSGRTPQDLPPPAPGVSEADAGVIPMALRAEPYVVRLLPGDAMRVESDGYACTIDLLPEDAQRLAEEYAALRQAGAATVAGAGNNAAGPSSAQPPAAGSPSAAQSAAAPSAPPSRPTDSGDTRPVSAKAPAIKKEARLVVETSPEGRALILMLVRERYRSALAERCGPPPR